MAPQTAPAPVLPIFDELCSPGATRALRGIGQRYIDRLYPVKKRFTTLYYVPYPESSPVSSHDREIVQATKKRRMPRGISKSETHA